MSFDSLPDCVVKCLQDAAEGLGCDEDDVQCICDAEVSDSGGLGGGGDLASCVLGDCPSEDMFDVGMDMLSFCDGTESDSSATRRATDTATETATRSTATSDAETTSEAASTNTSDPRVGDSRDGGSNSQSESGQDSGSAGLSTGAKAGIGIGAAIGVILLLLGAFLLGRRKRRGSKPRELPHPVEPDKAEYKGPELEGEKWVPELDGQRNQRPAELEADSPRTHPNFVKQEVYEKGHV